MQNFEYCTPTRLLFGRGVVNQLTEVMQPLGKRVLMTYGGGSIKRSGLYQKVKELLKDFEVYELSGIEPNPKYTQSVVPGVKMCKEHHIDVILAVGGGSVLDCSKAIAAGACYDGEPWDLITYKAKAQRALPIVDIMTMAATGSEYDAGGVITRVESNDKLGYIDPLLYPVCSLLDPELTFTVPLKHTLAGVADAMNHVMEQFFCADHTILNDAMCIGALRSLMTNVRRVIDNPEDYDARAEIFLTCTLGCNDIYSLGNSSSRWPLHAMEHTLSAYYDITHGEGLAIITPRWMQHILNDNTLERFVTYGTQLFGIDAQLPPMQIAQEAIQRTHDFFLSIGIPMTLTQVGIDNSRLAEMAAHTQRVSHLEYAWAPLTEQDIEAIYRASL
ncbi:MAG: iron-containing alcohol dehydrogenase [Bacteroidales bacterium]|nr:iron-containing alcohol dehydrogenase [Bacteroidales bacterium]